MKRCYEAKEIGEKKKLVEYKLAESWQTTHGILQIKHIIKRESKVGKSNKNSFPFPPLSKLISLKSFLKTKMMIIAKSITLISYQKVQFWSGFSKILTVH